MWNVSLDNLTIMGPIEDKKGRGNLSNNPEEMNTRIDLGSSSKEKSNT